MFLGMENVKLTYSLWHQNVETQQKLLGWDTHKHMWIKLITTTTKSSETEKKEVIQSYSRHFTSTQPFSRAKTAHTHLFLLQYHHLR